MASVPDSTSPEMTLESMTNYVSQDTDNKFSYKNFQFQDLSLQTQKEVKALIYTLRGLLMREIQKHFN